MQIRWRLASLAIALTLSCADPGAAPVCGNGKVEAGEECDDGNAINEDGCLNLCTAGRCGDGVVRRDLALSDERSEQCDDGNPIVDDGCDNDCLKPVPQALGPDERPAAVYLPENYTPRRARPLLLLLHGHGQNGALIERQFGVRALLDDLGLIVLVPEGTVSEDGRQFWNATSGCCDFHNSGVDDLGYLIGLIDAAANQLNADPKRVYVAGLSNGGFMAERLACDAADRVTGIINLSGSGPVEPERCVPSQPVAYMRLHSDADAVIPYEGNARMPSAATCIDRWRLTNGCSDELTEERVDLDGRNPGDESIHHRYHGCAEGAGLHLVTMQGSGHVPLLTPAAQRTLLETLMSYRR